MSVKNFVQCGLVTPVAANTTELMLMAPTASYQYPPLDGGTLVIADSVARPSFYEIISYTHRIENVLYGVVRAKEGTTARAWTGTTWIYQALTAQDYVDALALKAALASPAFTGIPTAPTAALGTNTNQIATMAALKQAIDALVGGAPGALDALNEFATALGNDPNFATTMTNALAGKEPSIAAGTSAQMWLGNKTWASVLSQVQGTLLTGLGAGANTPIVNTDTLIGALAKIQNQLNNKANFTDSRLSDAREWTATEVSQAEAETGTATVARKWTAKRVRQAVLASSLTGLNLTVGTAVAATDTVLVAIGKLQKQISDAAANLAGNVRATVLTGYVNGSAATLAATDTVLDAFGKLQAQINSLTGSKLDASANAVSATKLQTARTISLGGDLTGSVAFDGSANALLNASLPARLGKTAQIITDWNLAVENGYFQGTNALNAPSAGWTIGHVISHGGAGWVTQDVFSFFDDSSADSKAFRREQNNGVWGSWYRLRTTEAEQSALYNNASNLSSGIVPDARLSGTYTGVNITGNAASATKLQTARAINGVNFDGTANITVADATKLPLAGGTLTGGLTVPSLNGGQLAGMRNKIINGKMEIAQRGTSLTAAPDASFLLDRWELVNLFAAVCTVSQQADAPANNEFQNSLRIAVTTADSSVASNEVSAIQQKVEGFTARDLVGKTFTISFWVRSSKVGTHCVSLANKEGDHSYVAEYTVSAANTWEYKTITVPGGLITAGDWYWNTLIGVIVRWGLVAGSTFQTTPGTWQTGNFVTTANQVNCLDTAGNIFAITGVQLEVGSVATPFEHRPYGVELALCQRYTCLVENGGGGQPICNVGFTSSTTIAHGAFRFPTRMRAAPTFSILGGNASSFSVLGAGGSDVPLTALTVDQVGVDGCRIVATSSIALTEGYASVLRAATYPIAVFSAEL